MNIKTMKNWLRRFKEGRWGGNMITTLICQREILSTLDTTFNFILGEGGGRYIYTTNLFNPSVSRRLTKNITKQKF